MIGGTKFYERAEIKDAIAYLQVLVNPQDAGSFTRIVNSPAAGDRDDLAFARAVARRTRIGDPDLGGRRGARAGPGLAAAAVNALRRFMGTMHVLRERAESGAPVAELLKDVLRETGYLEWLEAERTIEAQGRIENLEELVNVAAEYDESELLRQVAGRFLEQVSLRSDADDARRRRGLVTLMTLHNAKGLEYRDRVHDRLRGGVLPHSRALDEAASRRSGASATSGSPAPSATST